MSCRFCHLISPSLSHPVLPALSWELSSVSAGFQRKVFLILAKDEPNYYINGSAQITLLSYRSTIVQTNQETNKAA